MSTCFINLFYDVWIACISKLGFATLCDDCRAWVFEFTVPLRFHRGQQLALRLFQHCATIDRKKACLFRQPLGRPASGLLCVPFFQLSALQEYIASLNDVVFCIRIRDVQLSMQEFCICVALCCFCICQCTIYGVLPFCSFRCFADPRSASLGTAFSCFVRSIRHHAIFKQGPYSWERVSYWLDMFVAWNSKINQDSARLGFSTAVALQHVLYSLINVGQLMQGIIKITNVPGFCWTYLDD